MTTAASGGAPARSTGGKAKQATVSGAATETSPVPALGAPDFWPKLEKEFLACHRKPLNVFLHCVTTPVGFVGAFMGPAWLHTKAPFIITLALMVPCYRMVPLRAWTASTLLTLALAYVASVTAASAPWWMPLVLIAAGYGGQDASHWISGEPTLQSQYEKGPDAVRSLAVHTWMLMPLLVVSAMRHLGFVKWMLPLERVVSGKLPEGRLYGDLDAIAAWVRAHHPADDKTTHWWYSDTPQEVQRALERVTETSFIKDKIAAQHAGCDVFTVHAMNEIYVAGPASVASSDNVFYMPHVDGPFAVAPFAAVYRCLVAVTENRMVETVFPLTTTGGEERAFTLTRGDCLGFDFNRELHFIRNHPGVRNTGKRVVLKVHYGVTPRIAPWYGRALAYVTARYDEAARSLFLATITPKTALAKMVSRVGVLGGTKAAEMVTRYVGYTNLAYVMLVATLAWATTSWRLFTLLTSFVHYATYMSVFHFRHGMGFGKFKRNVIFFKAVAYAQLIAFYAMGYSAAGIDWLSAGLIVVGYGLATAATQAIGLDRTYFGVEMGQLKPKWISAFPYNCVPHPMIVGAIVGLAGLHLHVRHVAPWLVPAHIACYTMHMIQEATDNEDTANERPDRPASKRD